MLQKVLAEEEKRKQKSVKNQSVKEKKSSKPRKNVKGRVKESVFYYLIIDLESYHSSLEHSFVVQVVEIIRASNRGELIFLGFRLSGPK